MRMLLDTGTKGSSISLVAVMTFFKIKTVPLRKRLTPDLPARNKSELHG